MHDCDYKEAKSRGLKALLKQMYALMGEGMGDEAMDVSDAVGDAEKELALGGEEKGEEKEESMIDDEKKSFMKGIRPKMGGKSLTVVEVIKPKKPMMGKLGKKYG